MRNVEKSYVPSRFRWTVAQSIMLQVMQILRHGVINDDPLIVINKGSECKLLLTCSRLKHNILCPRLGVAEGLPALATADSIHVSRMAETLPQFLRRHMVPMVSLVQPWDLVISSGIFHQSMPRSRAQLNAIL